MSKVRRGKFNILCVSPPALYNLAKKYQKNGLQYRKQKCLNNKKIFKKNLRKKNCKKENQVQINNNFWLKEM